MTIVVIITVMITIIANLAHLDDMEGMEGIGDMNGIRIMDDEPDKLEISVLRICSRYSGWFSPSLMDDEVKRLLYKVLSPTFVRLVRSTDSDQREL